MTVAPSDRQALRVDTSAERSASTSALRSSKLLRSSSILQSLDVRLTGAVACPSCSHEHIDKPLAAESELFWSTRRGASTRAELVARFARKASISGSNGRLASALPALRLLAIRSVLRDFKLRHAHGGWVRSHLWTLRPPSDGQGSAGPCCSRRASWQQRRHRGSRSTARSEILTRCRSSVIGNWARCGLRFGRLPVHRERRHRNRYHGETHREHCLQYV